MILPLTRPQPIVLAVSTFMGDYGSFFRPLVPIKSKGLRILPIGMPYFDASYGSHTNLIVAAWVMNVLPLIVPLVVERKYLMGGIQLGAVRG